MQDEDEDEEGEQVNSWVYGLIARWRRRRRRKRKKKKKKRKVMFLRYGAISIDICRKRSFKWPLMS